MLFKLITFALVSLTFADTEGDSPTNLPDSATTQQSIDTNKTWTCGSTLSNAQITTFQADLSKAMAAKGYTSNTFSNSFTVPSNQSALRGGNSGLLYNDPYGPSYDCEDTINVYWNVITGDSDYGYRYKGDIGEEEIEAAMLILNEDLKRTGLKFKLSGIEKVYNQDWFVNVRNGNYLDLQMKSQMKQGERLGMRDLNIYTVGFTDCENVIGYSSYPGYCTTDEEKLRDGVVLNFRALPGRHGGEWIYYSTGRLLVHEVGHWLGLLDVFAGGCSKSCDGDGVSDTPPQFSRSFDCLNIKSSCSGQFTDSPNNIMDLSHDTCRHKLTTGQIQKIASSITTFRDFSHYKH